MKKKIFAAIVAGAMVMSTLVGCGQAEATTPATDDAVVEDATADDAVVEDTTATDTTEVEADSLDYEASIDFEDGLYGFVGNDNKSVGGTKPATFSVVDYNGSKALLAETAGLSNVAFQMDTLLGDNVSKVASIDVTIGVAQEKLINAVSGVITTALDGATVDKASWSVYMANKNPKKFTLNVADASVLAAGGTFTVAVTEDANMKVSKPSEAIYIDNIAFKDADGNVLAADSSAAFTEASTGADPNLLVLGDTVELEGFAVSAGGWAQAGITLSEEQKALFVPGSVIEIEYKCDEPVWLVAICNSDNANPMGGWLRGINQDTFVPNAYVSDGKIQYKYEDLVEFFGEDYGQYLDTLQCEGKSDWEVYSVKVGKATAANEVAGTELEGFAVSAGGWAQAGIALTEEQKALFVPGSVIEIEYKCDDPVWLVAICNSDNPNPMGGWLRGINQDTFAPEHAAIDGKIQYTYEELVPYFGEDFGQFLDTLQCEGKSDWEVYSVKVGKPVVPAKNKTELEGFTVEAGGWAQAGIALTEDQKALFVPGCVIDIEYECEDPVWLVAICNSDNPNPMGGWLRGINQDTFATDGAAVEGKVQYTYEELVPYFGEDYGQFLDTLQCEGKSDWKVFSVTVGQR